MSDNQNKRKYLLFSKDDGRPDAAKPCAFFISPAGCRNGANCRFSHGSTEVPLGEKSKPVQVSRVEHTEYNAIKVDNTTRSPHVAKEKKRASFTSTEVAETTYVAPTDQRGSELKSKKEKRQKKSVEADESDTAFPVRQQLLEKSTVSTIEEKLLMQQKQFEEQLQKQQEFYLKQMTELASRHESRIAPIIVSKPQTTYEAHHQGNSSNLVSRFPSPSTKRQNLKGDNLPSQNFVQPTRQPHVNLSTQKQQNVGHVDDEEDDAKFLFGAVNTVLAGHSPGVQKSPHAPVKQAMVGATPVAKYPIAPANLVVKQPVLASSQKRLPLDSTQSSRQPFSDSSSLRLPIAIPKVYEPVEHEDQLIRIDLDQICSNDSSFPFLDGAESLRNLKTSGTDHATLGRRGPKDVKVGSAPHPQQTPMTWEQLVAKTREHPKHDGDYNFDVDSTWVQSKPWGDWCVLNFIEIAFTHTAQRKCFNLCLYATDQNDDFFLTCRVHRAAGLPPILAMDCEMCQSEDPLTGEKDHKALIRFSVVSGLEDSEVSIFLILSMSFSRL